MPQMLYNNFLPPKLPQMQHHNSLPTTLPQIQYNNSLPAPLPPERLPSTQSDNLFPDNCHPSDILSSEACQPTDTFSPVTLPLAQSGNFSPDNSSLSDILSAYTSEPSAQSDTFWTDPWQPIPLDNFSPVPLQPTPSDTWLSSDTFSPETSQPKPYEVFSPVLGQQSQTVLSYDGFWPENRIFAKPPEFIPADVVPPQTPSNQFNSFNYH